MAMTPCAVPYGLVIYLFQTQQFAFFNPILLPCPSPFPLSTSNHQFVFFIRESLSVLPIICLFYLLDSTYKCYNTVLVFFCLPYFTKHDILQIYPSQGCICLFFIIFIQLFLAAWPLCCCVQAFSSCVWGLLSRWGYPTLCGVLRLIAVASLVASRGFSTWSSQALEHRLRSRGTQIQLLRAMWDLPSPGTEPLPLPWQVDS